jgi:hypothetical protein
MVSKEVALIGGTVVLSAGLILVAKKEHLVKILCSSVDPTPDYHAIKASMDTKAKAPDVSKFKGNEINH